MHSFKSCVLFLIHLDKTINFVLITFEVKIMRILEKRSDEVKKNEDFLDKFDLK